MHKKKEGEKKNALRAYAPLFPIFSIFPIFPLIFD